MNKSKELAAWIAGLLNSIELLPNPPAWLAGARFILDEEIPSPHITVECTDGTRIAISFIYLQSSRAKREAIQREQEARRASPEYQLKRQKALNEFELKAAESHSEHPGRFADCQEILCKTLREIITTFGGDPYIIEANEDLAN